MVPISGLAGFIILARSHTVEYTLLEKFWRISLYVTYDAIAKLYVK